SAAADDLDLLDPLQRDAVPVDPAAEGVVGRHAVDQHERPAGAARADAAERETLGRGMRDETRRAPEEAEARTWRRRSSSVTLGDRLMSSRVSTVTLAGAWPAGCSVRVTVTTTGSSRAGSSGFGPGVCTIGCGSAGSGGDGAGVCASVGAGCWADTGRTPSRPRSTAARARRITGRACLHARHSLDKPRFRDVSSARSEKSVRI